MLDIPLKGKIGAGREIEGTQLPNSLLEVKKQGNQ